MLLRLLSLALYMLSCCPSSIAGLHAGMPVSLVQHTHTPLIITQCFQARTPLLSSHNAVHAWSVSWLQADDEDAMLAAAIAASLEQQPPAQQPPRQPQRQQQEFAGGSISPPPEAVGQTPAGEGLCLSSASRHMLGPAPHLNVLVVRGKPPQSGATWSDSVASWQHCQQRAMHAHT
jgi:hypothetical protein